MITKQKFIQMARKWKPGVAIEVKIVEVLWRLGAPFYWPAKHPTYHVVLYPESDCFPCSHIMGVTYNNRSKSICFAYKKAAAESQAKTIRRWLRKMATVRK